jgi:hypothetical protein
MSDPMDSVTLRARLRVLCEQVLDGPPSPEAEELARGVGVLLRSLASYEEGITWGTSCLNCARLLSQSVEADLQLSEIRRILRGGQ